MSQNSDSENEIFEDAVEDVKILSLDSQKEKHSVPEIDDATAVGIDTVQHDMNVLLTQDSSDNEDNCDSKPHLSSQQYQDSLNDDSNCKVNDDLNNVTSDDCDEVTKSNISDKGNNINTDETNETIGGGAVGGAASNSQSADANLDEDKEEDADKSDDDCDDEVVIEEDVLREAEANMTEEEKERRRNEAQDLKTEGNEVFKDEKYDEARAKYTQALLTCPLCFAKERSIMYSNRGACKYRQEKYKACINDCSKALEINVNYMKALLRRAECYEKTEKLDEALTDYQKALEMDPSLHTARAACMRLPEQIKERNEKLKDEMLGKLKDLGNMILKPFGLSTENFQMKQDPNSGSYSVNFNQGQQPPK